VLRAFVKKQKAAKAEYSLVGSNASFSGCGDLETLFGITNSTGKGSSKKIFKANK